MEYGPSSAFLLVAGFNLSGETYQLDETVEQMLEETHGLGDSWEEHKPVGLAKVMLDAGGGLYDDAVGGIVEALQGQAAATPTQQLVCFGLKGQGGNNGQEATILDGAFAAKWKRISSRDGLTHAHAEYTVSGEYKRGKLLHGIASETSDPGNTEGAGSVDNGASSANGATVQLHLLALNLGSGPGFTSFTVTVRHSPDDVSYANLVAFTTNTVVGAERKTVGGTVDRHTAIAWDFIGSGSGQSATPVVVIARG